ncbi:Ca2+-dependent phosphoinositide-specific phospholipase C [Massilia sp. W12]|uniref:Ca2+-dependent phosphoinositide-specific phospholipase C n=1 Tax=Massilia sp. W12 TaxID=3126507 RepID=UPI0030D4BCA6
MRQFRLPAVSSTRLMQLAMLAAISLPAQAQQACSIAVASAQDRYHEIMQPTCHNCYENAVARAMGANTLLQVLDKVKNIEIDFWDTRDALFGGSAGRWFVRHNPGTLFQSGNDNVCSGNGQGTNDLAACLTDVKKWSEAHPAHAPITIFLDKKQAWSGSNEGRRPADLDRLLANIFGAKLYTPKQMQQNYASLRQAAQAGAWPAMSQLQGRIIVVLNGGQLFNHNDTQNTYLSERGQDALAFVGPDADEPNDIFGAPNQFSDKNAQQVVFYNLSAKTNDGKSYELAKLMRANNYVSRLWGGEAIDKCTMRSNCVNDIALYKWNEGACNGVQYGKLKQP